MANQKSFAFYYGANPPLQELRVFDHVILEPDHVNGPAPASGPGDTAASSRWIAYVALGEVHRTRPYYRKIPKDWILGENPSWGSAVLDQTPEAWPDFYLAHVIVPLWKRGYRGFFLDALDSYELYVKSPEARARQEQGLIAVIRRIKKAYPEARLVLNRGFTILPEIHDQIYAVAFESLFRGWDAARGKFTEVSEEDRFYLLDQAGQVTKKYGLPAIAIDYVPASDREAMRATAERIRDVGLIPWVSTPGLDYLGVGSVEPMPRRILMLYDGDEGFDLDELAIHRNADPMLTYLGYLPEFRDIRRGPPDFPLAGRYAGIVCWLSAGRSPVSAAMATWLVAQSAQGIKIVFWGELPFSWTGPHAQAFGFRPARPSPADTVVRLVQAEKVMRFEMEPLPDARAFRPLGIAAGRPLLRIAGARNDTMVAAAYTPWGGYALSPFVMRTLPDNRLERWGLQPMEFLAEALRLPVLPAPDVTTENGTRLLMVHVDGDGFANQADWAPHPYSGEVLEQEILTKYPFATTFSVIEGEVAPYGMYPKASPQILPIAKRILALPHVEIASHSYSHPFNWSKFARGGKEGRENHLDIKGFRFGPDLMPREVGGSIAYINRELAPPGKTCKVFLWSGNCNPDARTVGLAYAAGMANMNGGETVITSSSDSWTGIAPIGIDKGGYYQIYAPNQNENMYTNEWTGPFYGYENVIETFERTDKPIRFKPVDIYYHSYSGSKQASVKALKKVYDWALGRELYNVYVSEYTAKVLDFNAMALAKSGDAWLVQGGGSLRELRIPASLGYPDLERSQGVIGYADAGESRYVHMAGASCKLALSSKPPDRPYLASANASLSDWETDGRRLSMTLEGHLDLLFALGGAGRCRVLADGAPVAGKPGPGDSRLFRLSARKARIEAFCP
jgi:uncharacterized protein (TIGR01370 family)